MDIIRKIYQYILCEEKQENDLGYEYDPNKKVSINQLTSDVDDAIKHHLSLSNDPSARRKNSSTARLSIEKFVGTNLRGETRSLLSANTKLQKANKTALTIPDGSGVETVGLTLAPAYQQGKFNTCPNSASCRETCLGKTSGGYFQYGGGVAGLHDYLGPKLAYLKRTHALLNDPKAFAVRLNDEINVAKYKAEMNGNHLGVRLNVLSDLHPKVFRSIINAHPDVSFYDYTKNNVDPIAPNHHITYSSTGVSQQAGYNGLIHSIDNPNSNWHQMRRRLNQGHNVAMVFSHRTAIPTHVHDEETGHTYHVISGDEHDFRPIDGRHESGHGYVIGLTNKAKNLTHSNSALNSNGFIVHYDPKFKSLNGKHQKDSAGMPIPSVTTVIIPKQKRQIFTLNNDGEWE